MQIFLRSLTGKTSTLDVTITDTVKLVKEKFKEREAIPVEYQVYIHEGKEMEDYKTLEVYGIVPDTTINVVQRLPGGLA